MFIKYLWMPADEFFRYLPQGIGYIKRSTLPGQFRLEQNMESQISQFFFQGFNITFFNGFNYFVGFFQKVGDQRL